MDAMSTDAGEPALKRNEPKLSEEIQNRIGDQLRLLYDQVAEEPVPEHLLELLRRLKTKK